MRGCGVGVEDRYLGGVVDIEIYGRGGVEPSERVAYGGGEYLPDGLFVLELYLVLGGMYVDVDCLGVDTQADEIVRLLVGGYQTLVWK